MECVENFVANVSPVLQRVYLQVCTNEGTRYNDTRETLSTKFATRSVPKEAIQYTISFTVVSTFRIYQVSY